MEFQFFVLHDLFAVRRLNVDDHPAFGWEVGDLGTIECSRALEEICMAWVYYGFASGGAWDHAFKLLRK